MVTSEEERTQDTFATVNIDKQKLTGLYTLKMLLDAENLIIPQWLPLSLSTVLLLYIPSYGLFNIDTEVSPFFMALHAYTYMLCDYCGCAP